MSALATAAAVPRHRLALVMLNITAHRLKLLSAVALTGLVVTKCSVHTAENFRKGVSALEAYRNGTLFLNDENAKALRPKQGYERWSISRSNGFIVINDYC